MYCCSERDNARLFFCREQQCFVGRAEMSLKRRWSKVLHRILITRGYSKRVKMKVQTPSKSVAVFCPHESQRIDLQYFVFSHQNLSCCKHNRTKNVCSFFPWGLEKAHTASQGESKQIHTTQGCILNRQGREEIKCMKTEAAKLLLLLMELHAESVQSRNVIPPPALHSSGAGRSSGG